MSRLLTQHKLRQWLAKVRLEIALRREEPG